ncbi:MAG: hypothetical protein HUJ68_00365, partial [Clostridia bacterium]|nr:hypothetical protein [Clostridia bacterium]
IKEKLKDIQLKYFIDIHNDEISKKNYIRISNKKIQKNKIAGIDILVTQSKLKRFIRALIKQKKLINIFSKTANEYVYKKYKCKTILVELSMSEKYENINELGKKFIKEMMGE